MHRQHHRHPPNTITNIAISINQHHHQNNQTVGTTLATKHHRAKQCPVGIWLCPYPPTLPPLTTHKVLLGGAARCSVVTLPCCIQLPIRSKPGAHLECSDVTNHQHWTHVSMKAAGCARVLPRIRRQHGETIRTPSASTVLLSNCMMVAKGRDPCSPCAAHVLLDTAAVHLARGM